MSNRVELFRVEIGSDSSFAITQEDEWLYPSVFMVGKEGESAEIYMQHTSLEKLKVLAKELNLVIEKLEKES